MGATCNPVIVLIRSERDQNLEGPNFGSGRAKCQRRQKTRSAGQLFDEISVKGANAARAQFSRNIGEETAGSRFKRTRAIIAIRKRSSSRSRIQCARTEHDCEIPAMLRRSAGHRGIDLPGLSINATVSFSASAVPRGGGRRRARVEDGESRRGRISPRWAPYARSWSAVWTIG